MCAAKIRRVKASFGRYPWDSAKEHGPQGYAFLKYLKSRLLGIIHRKISLASGGTTAYFGKRSGPNLGSWHQDPTLARVQVQREQ